MNEEHVLPRELEEVADLLRGFEPLAPEPALEEAALAAAGEGDPDVALGNLLIARGLLDADRAAEAWGLLQAYRRELPAVELSHVLRKHAIVEEAPLRALWAEIEERDRPAQPDAPAAATAPAPPPPAIGAGPRAPAPPPPSATSLAARDPGSNVLPLVDPDAAPPIPARLPPGVELPPGPHFDPDDEPRLRAFARRPILDPPVPWPPGPFEAKDPGAWPPPPLAEQGRAWPAQRPPFAVPRRAGGGFLDSDPWRAGGDRAPTWRDPLWVPPRSGPTRRRWAAVGVLVVGGLAGVAALALHLRAGSRARELELLRRAIREQAPERALREIDAAPESIRSDPELAQEIAELRARVERERRREAALAVLARLVKVTDLAQRLAICDEALAIDETAGRAWVERARAKWALKRRSALVAAPPRPGELAREAQEDVRKAIQVDPEAPEPHLFQAQLFLATGDRTSALSSMKRVQELDPDSALGQLAFAMQEEVNRRWDQALAHYGKAIERDPTLLLAYLGRARARIARSDHARALSDAREALRRDPTSAEALALQAEARYHATHRSDRQGPLHDLNEALRRDPTSAHALALRAYIRLERQPDGDVTSSEGDLRLAEQDATKALTLDGDEWQAHAALAEVARARKQLSSALTHASRAVETSKHPDAYLLRGRLRGNDGDDDNAASDFDWVLRLTEQLPGSTRTRARALANKAAIHIKRRELTEARQKLDKALELDPGMPEAYFNRGLARYYEYEARKQPIDLQQAIADFSEALNRRPGLADAWFYRAMTYFDAGRLEDALRDLETAETLRREGAGGFSARMVDFLRGVICFELGDYERARESLEAFMRASVPGDKAHPRAKELLRQIDEAQKPR